MRIPYGHLSTHYGLSLTKCMLLAKVHAGAWLIMIPYCICHPSNRVKVVQSQNQVSLHRQWNWMAGQAMAEPFFS